MPDDYLFKKDNGAGEDSEPDESSRLLLSERRESRGSLESGGESDQDIIKPNLDTKKLRPQRSATVQIETGNMKRNKYHPPRPLVRRNTVISGEPLIEQADRTTQHEGFTDNLISRSISTPSVIINNLREKIRRHVVQTSESAVVRDVREHYMCKRRNSLPSKEKWKSAEDSRVERIPMDEYDYGKDQNRLKVRGVNGQRMRRKSPPPNDGRSFSETQIANNAKRTQGSGIVCSKDDLRAIMLDYKDYRKKSPKSPRYPRSTKAVATGGTTPDSVASSRRATFKKQVSFDTSETSTIDETEYSDCGMKVSVGDDSITELSGESVGLYPDVFVHSDNETKRQIFQTKSTNAYYDIKGSLSEEGKNPKVVKDIIFDEHGQTWDIYGADMDAEILGVAIQQHLNCIMERTESQEDLRRDEDQHKAKRSSRKRKKSDAADRQTNGESTATKLFLRLFCLFGRKDG
jgi:hypothetical protein